MINQTPTWRVLTVLLLLAWGSAVSAQEQAPKTLNYAFVSPNTRENLKIEDAIKGMNSTDETQLRIKAINLSCVVSSRIRAYKALGAWSDGAEHSVMVRVHSDPATLRYLMSRMGRDAKQKYVIYFHPQTGGPDDFYVLRVRRRARDLVALSNALQQAGIPFRTLVPQGNTTVVYIIDLDRELRDKILAAAHKLRARVSYEAGDADLFGDDLRAQAKIKFEQEIRNYETKNPKLPPPCNGKTVKKVN
jgi:hypothetical protein